MRRPSRTLVVTLLVLALPVSLAPSGAAGGADDKTGVGGQRTIGVRDREGAAIPPAVVNITESITVADRVVALPPAVISIVESVGVADNPGGAPPPTPETPRRTP